MAAVGGTRTWSGILGQCVRGFLYIVLFGLALFGIIELMLEVWSWHAGARWRPEDINALISSESPTRQFAAVVWDNIKYLIQYGAYLIAAIALVLAVTQIKTIAKIVSDFIEARGPIYQLAATMTKAEESADRLAQQVEHLSGLEPTIQSTAEKIEEALRKLGDLQRLAVSERLAAPTEAQAQDAADGIEPVDENWERLRELWNLNGARLDDVIERIPDKRRRNRFSRMDRRNYPAIITGLADESIINLAAKEGSLKLHATFLRNRRNRNIPDQMIGDLQVLDGILEKELAPPKQADDVSPGPPNNVENPPDPVV
jgi:hypothetical protein